MKPEDFDQAEMPFGEPSSPEKEAWRKLFDQPAPLTLEEVQASLRELDAALERIYPAIAHGDVELVLNVVRDYPRVIDEADELFQRAIACNQYGVLDALLEAGLPAACINESGITPLMEAATAGHLEMVRRLLQAGADPNVLPEHHDRKIAPDAYGESAFFFALCLGDRALIDLLAPVTQPAVRSLAHQAHRRRQE